MITESIAILAICLGYLTITLGNALAYRIRYGKLPVGSMVPFEAKRAITAVHTTKRRRQREIALELEASELEVVKPAAVTMKREYELEARLEAQGVAIPIARAAARHARATLGDGAAPDALVREALRACPAGTLRKAA